MPTNLALLPSDKPLTNHRVQFKRGVADTAPSITGANNGQKLGDGAGGFMQISYTPLYPCWWVVRGNVMTHGIDVGWARCDFGIMITPADAEGVTTGYEGCMQTYPNGTVEFRTWSGSYMFRLNAGVAYTAYLATLYVNPSTNTVQYHTGPNWIRIVGRVVSEGVL